MPSALKLHLARINADLDDIDSLDAVNAKIRDLIALGQIRTFRYNALAAARTTLIRRITTR